jgi:hypothetical protein
MAVDVLRIRMNAARRLYDQPQIALPAADETKRANELTS